MQSETTPRGHDSPAPTVTDSELDQRNAIVPSRCSSTTITHQQNQSDFSIIWHNLTYRVDVKPWYVKATEKILRRTPEPSDNIERDTSSNGSDRSLSRKVILDNLCGDAKSRQLTGILGPSGAGKSSLLSCLFQNRTIGTTGRILVESSSKKRLKVCFIPQKDYLNEWLTVREDLVFVSKLKLAKVSGILKGNDSDSPLEGEQRNENISYVKQSGEKCHTTLIDHEANVYRIAELLGLINCLDVLVRNISGGQKKRLSIARELMSKPDIIILDEPTTGLDSLTCLKTMMVLRDLARHSPNPMAIIVTIHQPARSVFKLFDKTYFLTNKGKAIYDDNPMNVTDTLESVKLGGLSTAHYNPASTLIEIGSNASQLDIVERLAAHQMSKFSAKYDNDYIRRLMQSKHEIQMRNSQTTNELNSVYVQPDEPLVISEGGNLGKVGSNDKELNKIQDRRWKSEDILSNNADSSVSFNNDEYFISHHLKDCLSSHSNNIIQSFRHVFILTHRSWLSVIRNPTLIRSRLVFNAAVPLIMLMIFGTTSGTPNNCPKFDTELEMSDMRATMDENIIKRNVEETRLAAENISFFFILMYSFAINIISSTASHYPLTIHMFNKETINGLYSAGPYFLGQMLAELPLEIFFPSISAILAYSLSGQIGSYLEWRMFAVTLMIFLCCYSVHSLGLLFGSIFVNNISVAVLLGQVALFPPIVFSGFLIRSTRMPPWMLNCSIISFFKHAMGGVVAARYGFNVCDCNPDMFPEEGKPIGFKGLPENVKHVLEYMFPKNGTDDIEVSQIFEKLGQQFTNAQTFAMNITSCADVRPYTMQAFGVHDSDLYTGTILLLLIILVLKIMTFSIVKYSPYRID